MLDIKFIVEHPTDVKNMLKKRFKEDRIWMVDELLKDFVALKDFKKRGDDLRAQRNTLSQEINTLKKAKEDASKKIKEATALPKKVAELEEDVQLLQAEMKKKLHQIPNMIHSSVPKGKDESKNKLERKSGRKTPHTKSLVSHVDLLETLDGAELEQASKVSGARFYYLKNELAQLDMAVLQLAIDMIRKKGYSFIQTPQLLRKEIMEGAAELDDFEETLYSDQREDLFLIPTAEHAMVAYHAQKTLTTLPQKHIAVSTCFRREAGSHGKDTKGLFRVHEFRKAEQFVVCHPKESWKVHEELIKNAEEIMKALELPYRVVNIASGELNNTAAKKYDIESWMPVQNTYREMVSCSNCLDYQARKLNIRYNVNGEKGYPHLLNATAVATPRILVAILENHQQKNGSIKIPKALHKYLNFKVIKPKK